jgi:hypothetical protein
MRDLECLPADEIYRKRKFSGLRNRLFPHRELCRKFGGIRACVVAYCYG